MNTDMKTIQSGNSKYQQAQATELSTQVSCPGCVADADLPLCYTLSEHNCYDAEQRELIWLKVE